MREEVHAFIVRLHLTIAGGSGMRRTRYSVEDVRAGTTETHASFAAAAARLDTRFREIVAGSGQ